MSKHTPGPYNLKTYQSSLNHRSSNCHGQIGIVDSYGYPIAITGKGAIRVNWKEQYPDIDEDGPYFLDDNRTVIWRSDEEFAANNNLLKAAPDLLDALQKSQGMLLRVWENGTEFMPRTFIADQMDINSSALSKAEGKS